MFFKTIIIKDVKDIRQFNLKDYNDIAIIGILVLPILFNLINILVRNDESKVDFFENISQNALIIIINIMIAILIIKKIIKEKKYNLTNLSIIMSVFSSMLNISMSNTGNMF
jgi:hypothetical protein